MATDTRTPAEIAYDQTRLSPLPADYAETRSEAARLVDQALAAPAIEAIPTYRNPNTGDLTDEPIGPLAFTDYAIGADLTKVTIGGFDGTKPGVELIIGGTCINEYLREVITLADVRTLRDNLDALLADPRVQALSAA